MARQTAPLEVNSFVQGLITEASPLTFPENASIDEDNFELLRDGSRRRRLGLDFEEDYEIVTTNVNNPPSGELAVNTFSWKNAGGTPDKELLVVQTGRNLRVFDVDVEPLSSGQIYSTTISEASPSQPFSFAVIDGNLVCATGEANIVEFTFSNGSISRKNRRLKIRDFFGVSATIGGRNLREGNNVSFRPTNRNNAHIYNLRNQSWGVPRTVGDSSSDSSSTALRDPVQAFFSETSRYPSNADTVIQSLYADPSDQNNRTGDQFFPKDLRDNPIGNMLAANGHFIIDALDRGASRLQSVQDAYSQYSELEYAVSSLPADRTPGGASEVAEYAGRAWYAGFSGVIQDGDDNSPRMSSYVLYSKLVKDPEDITSCYQEGDPTSKDAPDLLDTDGGFIRIDGAYRIQKLVNVGAALMVLAENGVWSISGGSDFGFNANTNKVTKISEKGADSPGSVVMVDNTFMFWADDAIYHITQNEFGDWVSNNLTRTTIQKFYDDIRPIDKFYTQGRYDSYDGKVRWVYRNLPGDNREARELILDTELGSFYTSTIRSPSSSPGLPKIAAPLVVPPFRLVESEVGITVQGEPVTVQGQPVVTKQQVRGSGTKELAYLIVTGVNPLRYTFGLYRDPEFKDFKSHDGEGVDAEAFLLTGWASGGDFQRNKQVPYIQFHFNRTETGFAEDETGNLFPLTPSSCIVQAQWNWTNSANAGRWGREFEAYRYRRLYSPFGQNDPFDNGEEVITTKNKLRGKGKVVSLYIRTSPEKDCQLLGWSMLLGVSGNV